MTNIRAIAVAALAVVTVAGCAQPADMQAAGAPTSSAAGPAVFADIIDHIYGTPTQREAGLERQFYAWQAALGGCMVAKGAQFGLPTYVTGGLSDQLIGPGDMLAFSPQRTDFGFARRTAAAAKVPGTRDNPALLALSGADADAWIATQNDCDPATRATEELALPKDMTAVDAKLQTELGALQTELAPDLERTYGTCMAAAGVPANDLPDAMNIAGQKFPPVPADKASDPTVLPGWAEAVQAEKQIAATDWRCRGDDTTRVVNASGERLTGWAGQHSQELEAVAAQWAAMPAARDAAKAQALKVATK